jgi:hypothetical protein
LKLPCDCCLKSLLLSGILLGMPVRPVAHFPAHRTPGFAQLPANTQVRSALEWFAKHRAWIDDEQARLTEIPAPTFQEADRAAAVKVLLSAVGLEVSTDKTGNVIGLLRGTSDKELVVLSAHLDTVFPAGTDVTVRPRQEPDDRAGDFRQRSRTVSAGGDRARDS